MNKLLRIHLHGYWHAGTGRGEGPGADACVARDAAGLPYLPGRTVKGLLRAALRQVIRLGHVDATADDLARWFGTALVEKHSSAGPDERIEALEEARYSTRPGTLRFGSACIGSGEDARRWQAWGRHEGSAAMRARLFANLASTRIGEQGVAADRSLREAEVTVPLELFAPIHGPDDEAWAEALAASLPLLRAVGSHRRRGLGWCTCTLGDAP